MTLAFTETPPVARTLTRSVDVDARDDAGRTLRGEAWDSSREGATAQVKVGATRVGSSPGEGRSRRPTASLADAHADGPGRAARPVTM